MLAAAERWGGGEDERPFLPRAFSIARRRDGESHFLLEDVGPGTRRLCELRAGDGLWALGPLGRGLHRRRERAAARSSSAAASGIAPLAILQDALDGRGRRRRVLLGFRDGARAPRAPRCCAARSVATDDGSVGHHGLVTDLLSSASSSGDSARDRLRVRPGADARGRPRALRSARRARAARAGGRHGVRLRRLLRLRGARPRRRLPARVRRWPGDRRRAGCEQRRRSTRERRA